MKLPFHPEKLPIKTNVLTKEIINKLVKATESLAFLNSKIKLTKTDASFLMIHLASREAVFSNKIEGTNTTMNELYEKIREEDKNEPIDEVKRYIQALNYIDQIDKEPVINTRLLLTLHRFILGERSRGGNKPSGEYRTGQVYVGKHIPPEANKINEYMYNLENYMNDVIDDNLPDLIKCAIIHSHFETIHPFWDGNGRMGRILIPLYLYKKNKIFEPYFFLSKSLEKDKNMYYTYLQETRDNPEEGYKNWISLFLDAITIQTHSDIKLIEAIDNLYAECLRKINKNRIMDQSVLNAIFENPVFEIKEIKELTTSTNYSVRDIVKRLVDSKMIFKDQKQRNSKYYFYKLIDILSE